MSDERLELTPHLRRVVSRLRAGVAELANADGALNGAVAAIDDYLSVAPPSAHAPQEPGQSPVARLVERYGLEQEQLDLVVFAGLPDEHEVFAHLFRILHPAGRPVTTIGSFVQLVAAGQRDRAVQEVLLGRAVESGVVRLGRADALGDRDVVLADGLWSALCGIDIWPDGARVRRGSVPAAGLERWCADPEQVRIARQLRAGRRIVVVVSARSSEDAVNRARALAQHSAIDAEAIDLRADAAPATLADSLAHAALRDRLPIVAIATQDRRGSLEIPPVLAGPLVVCAQQGSIELLSTHPVVGVRVPALPASDRRRMWAELLPELVASAPELASRHPIEPHVADEIARNLRGSGRSELTVSAVSDVIRDRSRGMPNGGVLTISPTASWDDLVVPERQERLLRSAADRLVQQTRVLDEWGFLADRRGARGVRVLMTGPPGTGKTLAAEVLATEVGGVDLMVVDLSKVVSKWIGETEKNLSEIFDAAEHCVLFFDEADALFGRRTSVSDAHDRYANLETAYLLTRLEQFEGLAVLATNLKANIDPAFLRRMEFAIDFREPGPEDRALMWRRHVPPGAPLDPNVRFDELARQFDVVGGLIRNAVVGAAFLAASDDRPIRHDQFVTALQTEYEKAGIAFPTNRVGEAR